MSRRGFLQAGSWALGGLGLGDLLRLRAAAAGRSSKPAPDTAVILVWLQGGPSHLETYDLKPEAPLEYRGDFRPIPTKVPGIEICEHLPLQAQVADKFTIIRSISHTDNRHDFGAARFLTGQKNPRVVNFRSKTPAIGSIVSRMRKGHRSGMPTYVGEAVFGGGCGFLGRSALPTFMGNPNAANYKRYSKRFLLNAQLSRERLDDRIALLQSLDHMRRDIDQNGSMQAMDDFNQQAVDLLTSGKTARAFDIAREDPKTRDHYGRHTWGQRALLARRLVEAGVSFVTVKMKNPKGPNSIYNWDAHAVNCHLFKDMLVRLPIFDRAISALVEDLYQRGLDKKVLLVVAGEFGRTPKIESAKGRVGRDHWPQAMSVLVSGGGMQTGQVIGSTTSKGEHPKNHKLDPNDLLATMYRHLGIDQEHALFDHQGRPMPILPFGKPISGLL